jgi:hypothetical protein
MVGPSQCFCSVRWGSDPGKHPGPCELKLVTSWHRNTDALLGEHVPNVLETLILRERDRARISLTLQLARRVLDVGFH